ncbi:Plasmodium exported protein, unknown function [Plasmodium gallinaceum]|uniref:Fam-g protein n=1 Tax=Plasmodium gallinaceum TaxID=5849 RepID=A0A1J1GZG8_PLAGA|nr:Plasmodium exported protein, unknown function [Plasmodium gallinaceum]CRG97998.1 Plasmodium exported protein, unknown function [Plasmodium gallinaceum]
MNTFPFCLKVATFSFLIWIFQYFLNHNFSKSSYNKNIPATKFASKFKRTLAEVRKSQKTGFSLDDIKFVDEDCEEERTSITEEKKKKKYPKREKFPQKKKISKKKTAVKSGDHKEKSDYSSDEEREDESDESFSFSPELSMEWNDENILMLDKFPNQIKGMNTNRGARETVDEDYKKDLDIFEPSCPYKDKGRISDESLKDVTTKFDEILLSSKEKFDNHANVESEKTKTREQALRGAEKSDEKHKEQEIKDKQKHAQLSSDTKEEDEKRKKKSNVQLGKRWNEAICSMWKGFKNKTNKKDDE